MLIEIDRDMLTFGEIQFRKVACARFLVDGIDGSLFIITA